MEYFFKQLKKLRDATAFDAERKKDAREQLVNYMRATRAVREQDMERHNTGKRSATLTNSKVNMKLARFAVPVAILVLLGGGTSFAAASALPGDALYPVKVGVNEKVSAAFQFSPEAKAEYDAKLAEERLSEANELAVEGRLNAETSAKVQNSFQTFAGRVEARIKALRESGNDEAADAVSARFEAALEAHARALAAIQAKVDNENEDKNDDNESEAIMKLGLPLKAALKAVHDNNLNISARADVAVGFRLTAADAAIKNAREQLGKRSAQIGAAISAKADAELDAADALLVQAQAKAAADANVEAISLANRAAQIANQVKVLLNLQARASARAGADIHSDRGARLDLFDNSGHGSDDGQAGAADEHLGGNESHNDNGDDDSQADDHGNDDDQGDDDGGVRIDL